MLPSCNVHWIVFKVTNPYLASNFVNLVFEIDLGKYHRVKTYSRTRSRVVEYWCSRRYETADISYQVARQICIDTQPKKIKLQSYIHVKVDKNANPLILFLSKKTMFSLFPFFQAVEVAVTLKFQIRVGASNRHISARARGHMLCHSIMWIAKKYIAPSRNRTKKPTMLTPTIKT